MKSRIPKILMLGWEFPPVINGGLGIACHDLSVAMSEFAKITMIIPKSSPDFLINNLELIGLNNIDVNSLKNIPRSQEYKSIEDVHYISSDLNPYYSDITSEHRSEHITEIMFDNEKIDIFNIENLYGGDVIGKVTQFGKLAARLALTMDFDVIHAHDWMTMIAGMEIKAQTGKPLVMHIHSLEIDRGGAESKGWVYQIEKRGMEYADLLIPVSNFTGDNIHHHYGISRSKIAAVHNGISKVIPFKSKRSFTEKTVLFIGRLTRQKGPEFFLDIASKIIEKDPNVRFVMAGSGDNFKTLLEQSSYKHIGNRFHLTGFLNIEQVRYLLSITDVYCMPSVSEPFGLSAVEAAQFGIPCVISKQSGVAEVLKGSLKFDFWDINRAAAYILNLLNDSVLKEKVVNDANENLQHISWDLSAKKVMEAYNTHNIFLN